MAGVSGAQSTAARRRELDTAIRSQLRELRYPPQTEARAASELGHCALYFNLTAAVRPYPPTIHGNGAAVDPASASAATATAQPPREQLVCLSGNLAFQYNGQVQGIPICIYALRQFPHHPPVVFVIPPQGLAVPHGHTCVRPDGLVRLVELEPVPWQATNINLYSVLYHLQVEFARMPPLIVDPQVTERQSAVAELEQRLCSQLEMDSVQARMTLVQLTVQLQSKLNAQGAEDAATAAGQRDTVTPMQELQIVREKRMELDLVIEEYAMRDGDIAVDDLIAFDDDSVDDRESVLIAEERAIKDTLETLSDALGERSVMTGETFTKVSMKMATDLYKVRESLQDVLQERERTAPGVPAAVSVGAVGSRINAGDGGEFIRYSSSSVRVSRMLSRAT